MAKDCELMMNEPANNPTRVRFSTDSSQWHGSSTETLWAVCVGEGLRKVDNIPFFTFGISLGDIIKTIVDSDGFEEFVSVVKKSGHSTYRLILCGEAIPEDRLQILDSMGCLYEVGEFGKVTLVSISIPPESDIVEIYKTLEAGASDGVWDFEESNFEH
jgi:Domain of unknown function (DUF4265)